MRRLLLLALFLCGCSSSTSPSDLLQSITVTPPQGSVSLGDHLRLTATGKLASGKTVDLTSQLSWSSSDEAVVQYDGAANGAGSVLGAGPGSATVTATDPTTHVSGRATVQVVSARLVSLAVSPDRLTLPLGLSGTLTAVGTFSDGSTRDLTDQVSWSSDASAIATVSDDGASKGQVGSVALGTTRAQVSDPEAGLTAFGTVTVSNATPVSLALSPDSPSVPLGASVQLTAIASYSDGSAYDVTDLVSWQMTTAEGSTSRPPAGRVTGVGSGPLIVTATLPFAGVDGKTISASTSVEVSAAAVASLIVQPGTLVAPLGTSVAVTALATYTDGAFADVSALASWSSDDDAVASFEDPASSVLSARALGSTHLSASFGGQTASAPVLVIAAQLQSITVNGPATLDVGTSQPFQAIGHFTDGSTQDLSSAASWSSDHPAIASVSSSYPTTARVTTGGDQGPVRLTASYLGLSGSADVQVECLSSGSGSFSGGSGTAADPYLLCSAAQLANITNLGASYRLKANLDASGLALSPIGDDVNAFQGTFDGNGRSIRGIAISGGDYRGLFGVIASSGLVKNLTLLSPTIQGNARGGALAGQVLGTISHCAALGVSVAVDYASGGLVGELKSPGLIVRSASTGTVNGIDRIGGLVGWEWSGASIHDSYSLVEVVSAWNTGGGLLGGQDGAVVNSFSAGSVNGGGGLGADGTPQSTTSSYWDLNTSGQTLSVSGTGKTTAELEQQAIFIGWDFTDVWQMPAGGGYPVLR